MPFDSNVNAEIYIEHFDQEQDINTLGQISYPADAEPETTAVTLELDVTLADAQAMFQFKSDNDDFVAETATAKYVPGALLSEDGTQYANMNAAQLGFLEKLANAVFGSTTAVDLFSNEYAVATAYATAITDCASRVNSLLGGVLRRVGDEPGWQEPGSGLVGDSSEASGATGALDVLNALLNQHPDRFQNLLNGTETFQPMPLLVGDRLQMIFNVQPHDNQKDASGNDIVDFDHKALIQLTIV